MEVVKAVSRLSKNSLNGYSEAAVVCRDATADTTSMPSSHQLAVLAEYTYNEKDNADVLQILDKRLNDRGKMWRHTYKSLIILESLLFKGSRSFVRYFRQNLYVVKTLREFQYIDDMGTDQGANVREKARTICSLLYDEEKLDFERKHGYGTYKSSGAPTKIQPRRQESPARPKSVPPPRVEQKMQEDRGERDLKEAMRLSQLEEDERQRKLREQEDGALFGNFQQKQNDLLDLSAPSQEQKYDFSASQQAHQMELMRQQQLQAQAQAQAEYQMALQQQAYQNQIAAEHAYAQQMAMQQQQAMQQQHDYYAHQQQAQLAYQQRMHAEQQTYLQAPQPLAPQQTGANNPFAAFAPTPQPPLPLPTTSTTPVPVPSPNSLAQYQASQAAQAPTGKHSELERMLAGGSGIDTFGNVGNLRLGAHPTGQAFRS